MKNRQSTIGWLALVFLSTGLTQAQESIERRHISIYGQVQPARGETRLPPLVTVRIRVGPSFRSTRQLLKNADFEFTHVPLGDFQLIFEAEGYATTTKRFHRESLYGDSFRVTAKLGDRLPESAYLDRSSKTIHVATMAIPPDAARELSKAKHASQSGRLRDSITHLENALRIYPQFFEALNNLGVNQLKLDQFAEAEKSFQRALEINPENASIYQNLGTTRLFRENWPGAVESFSDAVRLDSRNTESWASLGEAYFYNRQYSESIDCFQRALRNEPEHPRANYHLGYALLYQKRFQEALQAFEIFLRNPDGIEKSKVESMLPELKKFAEMNRSE